jgi:hypothetical protein
MMADWSRYISTGRNFTEKGPYLEDTFEHVDGEELDTKVATLTAKPIELREGHQIVVVLTERH